MHVEMSGANPREILARFGLEAKEVTPVAVGLINETYRVRGTSIRNAGESADWILQRVNPIFAPEVHHNIEAVTARLSGAGLATPRLVHTDEGMPWLEHEGQTWRVMTAIEGVCFDRVQDAEQAHAAAAFLARWHDALRGLPHPFVGMRSGVHDTPAHLARLQEAVEGHRAHRLHEVAAPLANEILRAAEALPPLPLEGEARIIGHGDPKLNNLMFAGSRPPDHARPVAWIDLDTVGPIALAHELGDMWRSWCNRAGEDETEARLDLEVFEASARGYFEHRPVSLALGEAAATGLDWISLELAARFCADALNESYFGWNPARFPGRGEHNLHRARGQWSLHQAAAATRTERLTLVHEVLS